MTFVNVPQGQGDHVFQRERNTLSHASWEVGEARTIVLVLTPL